METMRLRLEKLGDKKRGFGIVVLIAQELQIFTKGKWDEETLLKNVNTQLSAIGYKIIETTEGSGLPDGAEYWWGVGDTTKYQITKI
jgi:hypothetical protein